MSKKTPRPAAGNLPTTPTDEATTERPPAGRDNPKSGGAAVTVTAHVEPVDADGMTAEDRADFKMFCLAGALGRRLARRLQQKRLDLLDQVPPAKLGNSLAYGLLEGLAEGRHEREKHGRRTRDYCDSTAPTIDQANAAHRFGVRCGERIGARVRPTTLARMQRLAARYFNSVDMATGVLDGLDAAASLRCLPTVGSWVNASGKVVKLPDSGLVAPSDA